MRARLEFQTSEGAAAGDLGDDLLVTALGTFARGEDLGRPTAFRRIALIHPEQVAGEQRRLIAAGAGADLQDDVVVVHGVLGNQRQPDVLLERDAARLDDGLLLGGDGAHVRLGRRIRDDGVEIGELGDGRPIRLHLLHDRGELGELTGELHISVGRERAGELRLQ